jgi:hypothetical protein
MERRSFIKGLLVSASAGTALVRLASEEEVSALVVNQPTILTQPNPMRLDTAQHAFMIGGEVYVRYEGMFVPIGFITQLHVRRAQTEVAPAWDGEVQYIPGLKSASFSFSGEE